ncbi:hypothetical protein BDV36DRAFT_290199 [Aspergillus pseudocaelatus]|uniref:Uncharacterized protein n=1 Tax=Aspergillus pseudocaelatus TaxID=1825620 RepID=A0ABQ6X4D8_9EURO|nr:hypothetical protein BDV36DRAFT_290199 [Aspergillus pseudocaelatus]
MPRSSRTWTTTRILLPPIPPAQNPDGCPSIGFGFGHFSPASTDMSNVTAAVCDQLVEKVWTEATFLLPSLELDASRSPVPDESTAHILGNGHGYQTRQYRPEYQFSNSLASFLTSQTVGSRAGWR